VKACHNISLEPANRRLWSLWEMLSLEGKEFTSLIHLLINIEMLSRRQTGLLGPTAIQTVKDTADSAIKILVNLDLPVSTKTAQEKVLTAKSHADLNSAIRQLFDNIKFELDGRKFYGPLRRYEQYYEQPKLFGDAVFSAFPSANNDIFEAGTCLALERGTACVMHLMRVAEVGLKALATAVGVGVQGDWGGYLRLINEALEASAKAAGKRTPDEQFYAETRVTLDGVRMAWRNGTMHVENNYSPERAEEILAAVRGLMRHLATKLSE
jgi:hypothetical protein